MGADRTEGRPTGPRGGTAANRTTYQGAPIGLTQGMAASPSPRRRAARTRAGASSGTTMTLADFRSTVGTLTPAQRATVVRQAMAMIDGLYVHLPLKRAMHATEPVQRLRHPLGGRDLCVSAVGRYGKGGARPHGR